MTDSLTTLVKRAAQQLESAGSTFEQVKCSDSTTMVDTGCGYVPSLRKILNDLGGYRYRGEWKANTEYLAKDQAKDENHAIWLCLSDHTSTKVFADDIADGYWVAWQVILDTPVFNRKVVNFTKGATFAPYKEDARNLIPRLRVGVDEYVAVSEITDALTFTSDVIDDHGDGMITVKTSTGDKVFSQVDAEAVTRQDLGNFGVVKTYNQIADAEQSARNSATDRIQILERNGALFKKASDSSAANVPELSKFQDKDGNWWVLDYHQGPHLDIRWFGAKSSWDGKIDSTEAIQNALDIGGNIFIPPKSTFYVSNLYLDQDNTDVYGGGTSSVICQDDDATGSIFSRKQPVKRSLYFINIHDLTIDGHMSGKPDVTSNHGIDAQAFFGAQIYNCFIKDTAGCGIKLYGDIPSGQMCLNIFIHHNRIGTTRSYCVFWGSFAGGLELSNNIIGGSISSVCEACVHLQNVDVRMHSNHVHNGKNCLLVRGDGPGLQINNNHFESAEQWGVVFYDVNDVTFVGNMLIKHSRIKPGAFGGLKLMGQTWIEGHKSTKVVISDNVISSLITYDDGGQKKPNHKYGIFFDNSAVMLDSIISGNSLTGNQIATNKTAEFFNNNNIEASNNLPAISANSDKSIISESVRTVDYTSRTAILALNFTTRSSHNKGIALVMDIEVTGLDGSGGRGIKGSYTVVFAKAWQKAYEYKLVTRFEAGTSGASFSKITPVITAVSQSDPTFDPVVAKYTLTFSDVIGLQLSLRSRDSESDPNMSEFEHTFTVT